MTRYLISFPGGAMDHIPDEEFPAVGDAAHAVAREAMDAGVWVFGGGLVEDVDPVLVAGDGTVVSGTYPQTRELSGGFTVLDVATREAALDWAAKIAAACRCAQEVREFMADPAVGN
ncbi:MAG TPA: YciI family protein [Solirubrobacteraceae bacterium]|nr:YciI family protein [Solirubrobacteraceae bacterium]